MKIFSALVSVINFVSWLFDIFKKWQFKIEARAEAVRQIKAHQEALKEATDEIIDTDITDSELTKRLQDGQF